MSTEQEEFLAFEKEQFANKDYSIWQREAAKKDWCTKQGEWMKMSDMGTQHLKNSANMMLRKMNAGRYDAKERCYAAKILTHMNQELLSRGVKAEQDWVFKFFGG